MALRLAFALLVPFLLCSGALSNIEAFSATSDFDHYRLILVWPGSICNSADVGACCEPYTGDPSEDFLVQDLQTWKNLSKVEKCTTERFYINAINGTVRHQMMLLWTTLECPSTSPQQMWNTTWILSGTCSGVNETIFYQTGLNISAKANVLGALSQNGIVQSENETYPLEGVRNALDQTIGKKVVVTCNKNQDDKSQIYSVHVCANNNGSALIDCPHSDSSCPQSVMFPVFTTDMLNDTSYSALYLKMVV